MLEEEINKYNEQFHVGIYLPLWEASTSHYCICRLVGSESKVLKSRERAPFILTFEVVQGTEPVSSKNIHRTAKSFAKSIVDSVQENQLSEKVEHTQSLDKIEPSPSIPVEVVEPSPQSPAIDIQNNIPSSTSPVDSPSSSPSSPSPSPPLDPDSPSPRSSPPSSSPISTSAENSAYGNLEPVSPSDSKYSSISPPFFSFLFFSFLFFSFLFFSPIFDFPLLLTLLPLPTFLPLPFLSPPFVHLPTVPVHPLPFVFHLV